MPPTQPPARAAAETRERLLDAAERLFSEHGVHATSLRRITAAAGANLAAVNYHFGSKLELAAEVFRRRLAPMNAERLARLDAVLARGAGPPDLRAVLVAFLAPALHFGRHEGRGFFQLVARAHIAPDPELRRVLVAQFGEVAARFGAALSAALPGAPPEELFWRVFFVVGAMCHAALNHEILREVSGGRCDASDEPALLERLVDFAVAGVASAVPPRAPDSGSDTP